MAETMSDGHSFDCCGHWVQHCAANKGCRYLSEDFEFAVNCSVFKRFYIDVDPVFIAKWQSQIDENGEVIVRQQPVYTKKSTKALSDADILIAKLKGNDSIDDIMKLLGL